MKKDITRAENLGYIRLKGKSGYSYRFTDKGQRLVDGGYNFSVTEELSSVTISGSNVHIGDNKGGYHQEIDQDKKGEKKSYVKEIIIGIVVTIVGGLFLFFILDYLS